MRGLLWSLVALGPLWALGARSRKQHHQKVSVGCTDSELLQLSLFLAIGPLLPGNRHPLPECIPSGNQSLPAPWSADLQNNKKSRHVSHSGSHLAISVKNASQVPSSKHHSKSDNPYFVHLLVVQSNQDWCEAPCNSPSWELSSPKPKQKDGPYALFEAAIWRQERRVALYRFDAEWETRARASYHRVCGGTGWGCPAYRTFREARALLKVGPWPATLDRDGEKLSAWLANAFTKVFATIKEKEPNAEHFGLSYQGHGSTADGSLFEGALNAGDAAKVLKGALGPKPFGAKFALLNFGGNCNEGKWNMLAALHWSAEWITASDLPVGGLDSSSLSSKELTAMAEARTRLNDPAILMRSAEEQKSIEQIVKDLINGRKELWAESWKPLIKKQNLAQSISGYKTNDFPAFAQALKKAYKDATTEKQEEFVKTIEKSSCDVLTGVRVLEPSLEAKFQAVVTMYASTKEMTKDKWKVDTNGLGFNFLGWKGPPCDLHVPVGAPKVEPTWTSGYASVSEEDFANEYPSHFLLKKHNASRHHGPTIWTAFASSTSTSR